MSLNSLTSTASASILNPLPFSKASPTTRKRLLETGHSESSSKLLLRKQERQWPSRRYSKTNGTKTESSRSWKCCTIRTVSKWGSLSTLMGTSRRKCIWTLSWTIFQTRRTVWWSSTSRWSRWCLTSWSSSTPTNCFAQSPTSTRRASATVTSSRRTF